RIAGFDDGRLRSAFRSLLTLFPCIAGELGARPDAAVGVLFDSDDRRICRLAHTSPAAPRTQPGAAEIAFGCASVRAWLASRGDGLRNLRSAIPAQAARTTDCDPGFAAGSGWLPHHAVERHPSESVS